MFKKALETYGTIKEKHIEFYIDLRDVLVEPMFPIFYATKPTGTKGIIIPDWTYQHAYKSQTSTGNWGAQKTKISNVCDTISYEEKKMI